MPCYTTYDNDTLLLLLKQGDKDAFTTIYNYYWETLYKAAFNILHDENSCLDIVHDVFVWLWSHREELEIATLGSYLRTAVKFKMLNVIRNEKIRQAAIERYNSIATSDYSEEVTLEVKELQDMIDTFIRTLPEQAGRIFRLSRNEQLSHKEIAQQLHLSEGTVKKQINISLKKLRIALSRHISLWTGLFL